MTSPASSGPRPTTFVVVSLAAAVLVSIAAAVWLLGPGAAPAHPYDAGASSPADLPVPQSRSYERGPDPAAPASASPGTQPANPAAAAAATAPPSGGPDSAQQAALAAAALAGSDAAQITADGYAITTGQDSSIADAGPTPTGAVPSPTAAPGTSPTGPTAWSAPRVPVLLFPATAADVLGADGMGGGSEAGAPLKAEARAMMLDHGFGAEQWTCLDSVITRESGWHVTATNIRSGAYGLPQALPATKMATAGADWQTNPHTQLTWMLDYVARRYTDPCGAWAHELSDGWY